MQTYGQFFEAALKCETEEQAKEFLAESIARMQKVNGCGEDEARRIVLSNLGYIAGYYDHETAQKVHKLFGAVHPIFGTSTYHKDVSPEQAFQAGVKAAKEAER